jgi:putative transposase
LAIYALWHQVPQAKHIIEQWRQKYKVSRPHRALADRASAEFASEIAASRDLAETKQAEN